MCATDAVHDADTRMCKRTVCPQINEIPIACVKSHLDKDPSTNAITLTDIEDKGETEDVPMMQTAMVRDCAGGAQLLNITPTEICRDGAGETPLVNISPNNSSVASANPVIQDKCWQLDLLAIQQHDMNSRKGAAGFTSIEKERIVKELRAVGWKATSDPSNDTITAIITSCQKQNLVTPLPWDTEKSFHAKVRNFVRNFGKLRFDMVE